MMIKNKKEKKRNFKKYKKNRMKKYKCLKTQVI